MRPLGGTNKLIKLDLNSFCVTVLGVLYQKDHQKSDDRRAGIDHQLPCIAELKQRSGNQPDNNQRHRKRKNSRAPAEMSGCLGKAGVPGCAGHTRECSRNDLTFGIRGGC